MTVSLIGVSLPEVASYLENRYCTQCSGWDDKRWFVIVVVHPSGQGAPLQPSLGAVVHMDTAISRNCMEEEIFCL